MNVGVHFPMHPVDLVDDAAGLLGRCSVIEVGQWLSVHLPGENGKLLSYFFYIPVHYIRSIFSVTRVSNCSITAAIGM